MRKLERDALLADRQTVESLLVQISGDDPMGRLSFEARLNTINDDLAKLQGEETTGSVALMFAGTPVHGSRSIDADFTGKALQIFQDLVTKDIASAEFGTLGGRGRLPMRTDSSLSLREIVRGSVGFVLEESGPNTELISSAVKASIENVTDVIARTAAPDQDSFEQAVESVDPRVLVSLRHFFQALDDNGATVRIVENQRDESLDAPAVHRGRERIDQIQIKDQESDKVYGELLGLLPGAKRFEMKLADTGEIITGKVAARFAEEYMALIEAPDKPLVGRSWRAKMKIREVTERNKPPRNLYTLLGLIKPVRTRSKK